MTEIKFSQPEYAKIGKNIVSFFRTRFLQVGGNQYEIFGTSKVNGVYFLDLKNMKTKQCKTVPFDNVVGWFKNKQNEL